ncbi:MAG: 4-alpha-glucanotransferase [Austwickia sp.]|nr:4-alpha-glucanotransferase [Austwickia sp.]MBK8434962.1 4-alpha-glucanotransferase [Austwickia sp.]MBK9101480.1 4-alpha-glucanotransferase [Austwickia sp.]
MVSAETITAVLAAMGISVTTDEQAQEALRSAFLRPWRRRIATFTMARAGTAPWLAVHVPHGEPVTVWVQLEDQEERRELTQVDHWVDPREVDGTLIGEATFSIPADLPIGYHTLHAEVPGQDSVSGHLVVVPNAVPLPGAVANHGAFGLTSQIYSVRSQRSWGIGDFSDLAEMAVWSARTLGADFVLVNPIHAAEPIEPLEPSPYLPTSRRFVNPIYLRVEEIDEVSYLSTEDSSRLAALAAQARGLNRSDIIDRDAAWTAKRAALEIIFRQPRSPRRQASFDDFREAEGQGLEDFATWCVLAEKHGPLPHEWPAEYDGPQAPAVREVAVENADRVMFWMWLQWLLDLQLARIQTECRAAGMSIGMMQDLAVGVHPDGADSWALGDALARGVTVGAPPDAYSQRGQDWSQPPWRPDKLADMAYLPYRDLLRNQLRNSGGLRIDHIIGLFRLWWVPQGCEPIEGTYVRYDHEALIGLLVLEAYRAGAVIVGEDLGTVEPWVRDYLADRGILGTSILWFEVHEDGTPRRAEDYRRLCLASVTTHDLPPTAGYLEGEHIRVRAELDLFTRSLEEELAVDEAQRGRMLQVLRERGLLGPTPEVDTVVEALHRYLSWSPALLMGIAVPDLTGDRRVINQPGTDEEYPNWRLPLAGPDRTPVMLEDLMASPRAKRLAECAGRGRRPL